MTRTRAVIALVTLVLITCARGVPVPNMFAALPANVTQNRTEIAGTINGNINGSVVVNDYDPEERIRTLYPDEMNEKIDGNGSGIRTDIDGQIATDLTRVTDVNARVTDIIEQTGTDINGHVTDIIGQTATDNERLEDINGPPVTDERIATDLTRVTDINGQFMTDITEQIKADVNGRMTDLTGQIGTDIIERVTDIIRQTGMNINKGIGTDINGRVTDINGRVTDVNANIDGHLTTDNILETSTSPATIVHNFESLNWSDVRTMSNVTFDDYQDDDTRGNVDPSALDPKAILGAFSEALMNFDLSALDKSSRGTLKDSEIRYIMRLHGSSMNLNVIDDRQRENFKKELKNRVIAYLGPNSTMPEGLRTRAEYLMARREVDLDHMAVEDLIEAYDELKRSTFAECAIPDNPERDLWADGIDLDINFNLTPPTKVYDDGRSVDVLRAVLRLYKIYHDDSNVSTEESPDRRYSGQYLDSDKDMSVRVTVFWYIRNGKRRKIQRKLADSKMVNIVDTAGYSSPGEWVEFNIRPAVRNWLRTGNQFGLSVIVEDQEGEMLRASNYFRDSDCSRLPTNVETPPIDMSRTALERAVELINAHHAQNPIEYDTPNDKHKSRFTHTWVQRRHMSRIYMPTIDICTVHVPNMNRTITRKLDKTVCQFKSINLRADGNRGLIWRDVLDVIENAQHDESPTNCTDARVRDQVQSAVSDIIASLKSNVSNVSNVNGEFLKFKQLLETVERVREETTTVRSSRNRLDMFAGLFVGAVPASVEDSAAPRDIIGPMGFENHKVVMTRDEVLRAASHLEAKNHTGYT